MARSSIGPGEAVAWTRRLGWLTILGLPAPLAADVSLLAEPGSGAVRKVRKDTREVSDCFAAVNIGSRMPGSSRVCEFGVVRSSHWTGRGGAGSAPTLAMSARA